MTVTEEILELRTRLTPDQMETLVEQYTEQRISNVKVLLFWLCTLGLGGHRFYLGDMKKGFLMLITLGGFGIWSFCDMFAVSNTINEKNQLIELKILKELLSLPE